MQRTKHMTERMQQRGISQTIVDIVLAEGDWAQDGERFHVTRKHIDEVDRVLRRYLKELDRLRRRGGASVVIDGEVEITTYFNA